MEELQRIERSMARWKVRVLAVVVATLLVDMLGSLLALVAERGAKDAFGTIWEAGFWVTTQLLTVSSQLPNPERTATKLLDVFLEAWGVVVVASAAGITSDYLHHRSRRRAIREG